MRRRRYMLLHLRKHQLLINHSLTNRSLPRLRKPFILLSHPPFLLRTFRSARMIISIFFILIIQRQIKFPPLNSNLQQFWIRVILNFENFINYFRNFLFLHIRIELKFETPIIFNPKLGSQELVVIYNFFNIRNLLNRRASV